MATQWRPANSSDDESDDIISVPTSTKDLLEKISSESTTFKRPDYNQATVEHLQVSPISNHDTSSTTNTVPMPRVPSTDSIVEMLRSSGIASEMRDSRRVQWHHQTIAENPNRPSGCLVSGTKDLYLNDDFFIFRDSNGERLRHPVPVPPLPISAKPNTGPKPLDNAAEFVDIPKHMPKKNKSSKSVVNKKQTNGKKRTAWKKLDIDITPNNVPGPPEEKGYSGRNRFN